MSFPELARPEGAAGASTRLNRHIRSPKSSYDAIRATVKQALREHYPNLSPTRAPSVPSDVALWPHWTKISVEDLDLDGFDDDGNPVRGEGGWRP